MDKINRRNLEESWASTTGALKSTNNLIHYTSGFIIPAIVGIIAYAITTEVAIAAIWTGIAAAVQTLAMGGSVGDAFKAGIIAGVSSYAFGAIGEGSFLGMTFSNLGSKAFAMGVVGGITSTLQGGKFGHGFVAAGVGGLAGGIPGLKGNGGWQITGRAAVGAIVGGTSTKISGGKFANGATTGAFTAAFAGVVKRIAMALTPRINVPQIKLPEFKVNAAIESVDVALTGSQQRHGPPSLDLKVAPIFDESGFSTTDIWESVPYSDTPTYGDLGGTGYAPTFDANDLIANGYDRFNQAGLAINSKIGTLSAGGMMVCPACTPVLGPISIGTTAISVMGSSQSFSGVYNAGKPALYGAAANAGLRAVKAPSYVADKIGNTVEYTMSLQN